MYLLFSYENRQNHYFFTKKIT